MEAYSPRAKYLLKAMDKKWFRSLAFWIERVTIPGILLHYVLRKHYLEDVAHRAIDEGFHQVVILGAGFDTLALRLHQEFRKVRFIEVDHPATQRVKRQILEWRNLPKATMKFLAVDFARQSLEESLLSSKEYNREADTLFIAEGVLIYLKTSDVDTIFRFIREYGGRRSRFAFTFMEPQANGEVNFRSSSRAVDLWLWLRDETFKWGIRRENLASFLEARDFSLQELVTSEAFQRYLVAKGLERIPLEVGEYCCVAERSCT